MELSKLHRLAELKLGIAKMKSEADEIQAAALIEMKDTNAEELVAEGLGKLVLVSKAKWVYPESISKAEAKLKADKKSAEQLGTATNNPTVYTKWLFEGDQDREE